MEEIINIETELEAVNHKLQRTPETVAKTLKMMGVKGMKIVFVKDAFLSMRNCINQKVLQAYRNEILSTVVMDKTLREWYKHFIKTNPESRTFNIDDCDLSHLYTLVELVLQVYYKKEFGIGK
jgi:hypothetical protein